MFMMKSEVVGCPSVVSDDLVLSVDQKICEIQCFTISELASTSTNFTLPSMRISQAMLTQVLCNMGSENTSGAYKTQRMALALTLCRPIPQRWRRISQSHCTSNRWWNLGFICECWNQTAVKAYTFTKQAEKVQTNVAYQRADASCLLREERSADSGIHATINHNVISVLHVKQYKNCLGTFRTKDMECWHQCCAPPWQCKYSCYYSSIAAAFLLAVIWPPSLQPSWSFAEWLLPEELVGTTVFQQ
jgi:hypothetical protein